MPIYAYTRYKQETLASASYKRQERNTFS